MARLTTRELLLIADQHGDDFAKLREALEDVKAGRTVPLAEAIEQIRSRGRERWPG